MKDKNILIIKLSAIGDVIHALPVAHALKNTYPDCRITWIVEKAAYELLTNNPYIDEVLLFDKPQYKSVSGLMVHGYQLMQQLREKEFDVAVDLQGLAKSAAISLLSGAKEKWVYCNARELSHWVGQVICGQHAQGHVVDRYLDVAAHMGCSVTPVAFPISFTEAEEIRARSRGAHAGLKEGNPYVILVLGANWPNKRWPARHFALLADALYNGGLIPVLAGSNSDDFLAEEVTALASIPPINLVGKTTLKEAAYLLKQAQVVVGGDTGPMHLAVAVGTPVVALFGPTDPKRNGPYYKQQAEVITVDYECQGCWKRSCIKNIECMAQILPEQVYEAILKLRKVQDGKHV